MKFFWNAWAVATILAAGCSAGDSIPAAQLDARPAAFNVAGDPTVDLSVPDMMCEDSCAKKVQEVLAELPGAKDVLVDFPGRVAHVAIDKHEFSPSAAVAALVDHGFAEARIVLPTREDAPAPASTAGPGS